jgi:hypothetical protein
MLAATNVNFTQKVVDSRAMFVNMAERQLPFGQLPLLQIDGNEIVQSQAAIRYLARRGKVGAAAFLNLAILPLSPPQQQLSSFSSSSLLHLQLSSSFPHHHHLTSSSCSSSSLLYLQLSSSVRPYLHDLPPPFLLFVHAQLVGQTSEDELKCDM